MQKKEDNNYIGVIDIGTTSIRFILFYTDGRTFYESFKQISQIYPDSGWVEEDPSEILNAVEFVVKETINKVGGTSEKILALGLCNQRESTLIWDKRNGEALSPVIVWQDRRTSKRCDELKKEVGEDLIRSKTGLRLDPYFSATKLEWLLKSSSINSFSNLAFGTLDSWIIFKLTGNHLTDVSNASRTLLFNIKTLIWDDDLLSIFNIPRSILPDVKASYGDALFGYTKKDSVFKREIPVCSVLGDQQAALFGQKCFKKGDIKSTFGTGCFLMMNTGKEKINSKNNLLTTIFYKSDAGEIYYALEGSIYNAGSIYQWLKEEMNLINEYSEIALIGKEVGFQKDFFIVPAFTGLGAPYWDPYARGLAIGISRSTGRKEFIRATLESVAYRTRDVTIAMENDTGIKFNSMKIDGGVSKDKLFCQILSDILGIKIIKFEMKEITALGAMYSAGLGYGIWGRPSAIEESRIFEEYVPSIEETFREELYNSWKKAVDRSKGWMLK